MLIRLASFRRYDVLLLTDDLTVCHDDQSLYDDVALLVPL